MQSKLVVCCASKREVAGEEAARQLEIAAVLLLRYGRVKLGVGVE